jgi:hypothetical protein
MRVYVCVAGVLGTTHAVCGTACPCDNGKPGLQAVILQAVTSRIKSYTVCSTSAGKQQALLLPALFYVFGVI